MQFNIKNTKSELLFFLQKIRMMNYGEQSRVTEETNTDKKQVDTIKIQIEIQIHIEN